MKSDTSDLPELMQGREEFGDLLASARVFVDESGVERAVLPIPRAGKVQFYEVQRGVLDSMKDLPPSSYPWVQRVATLTAAPTKLGVIYTPVFQVAATLRDAGLRPLLDDVGTLTTAKVPIVAQVEAMGRGILAATRIAREMLRQRGIGSGQADEMVEAFFSSPAAFASLTGESLNNMNRVLREIDTIRPLQHANLGTVLREIGRNLKERH
jgi:hypothetical protein